MTVGSMIGFPGNVPPLFGECEFVQKNLGTDMITLTGVASQTADFLVIRNSAKTELLYITYNGRVYVNIPSLGAAEIGVSVYVTVSAPNNQSGMSGYFDVTIAGTTAGHCYGLGSWINTGGASPVLAAGHIIVPFEGGVYTGEAQANARIVFAGQHQAVLGGAPATLHAWRLNTNRTITALIAAGNSGSVAYTASTATSSNKVGDVALFDIAGGPGVRYVRLYDAAG